MLLVSACVSAPEPTSSKRIQTVERYHDAIVRQLVLADSKLPADYTVNALRSAEADMIEACEPVDKKQTLGTPTSTELDRCEDATATVDQLMQQFVPGAH